MRRSCTENYDNKTGYRCWELPSRLPVPNLQECVQRGRTEFTVQNDSQPIPSKLQFYRERFRMVCPNLGEIFEKRTQDFERPRRIRLQPRTAVVNELTDYNEKQAKLQKLLQQIYQAEESVRKETLEVKRLQEVVAAADQELEGASNQVRALSSDLQEAQRTAAQRALKSHSAHLQLSAHDQLMFTSRQRVDALSAQAIAAQADIGVWPSAGMYYNASIPLEEGEQQGQVPGLVYPRDMLGGYGKAPVMYRNAVQQPPQYYPLVSNGFQYVPMGAG